MGEDLDHVLDSDLVASDDHVVVLAVSDAFAALWAGRIALRRQSGHHPNEHIMFRPGDDRVATLLLWHMVEEVEHRSSALTIYNAVVGRRLYRLRVLPSVIRHIMDTRLPIYVDGVNSHVPEADRILDLRVMSVSWRIREQLRSIAGRDGRSADPAPPMLKGVDRKDKRQALTGLILSQNPYFDPAAETVPSFAGQWFDRYERGDDVTLVRQPSRGVKR